MNSSFLANVFIFLAAASIIVPLASRFKLGSVLGYLIIGTMIGPFGLHLFTNTQQIMHFAEFGVVMMLFLIGLELKPTMLWRLRKMIVGLGGLQVTVTTALFTAIGISLGYNWQVSMAVSMSLALSSTALVLQMLQEKNLLRTAEGEASFSVLLFQDIAVIVILLILPLLAVKKSDATQQLSHLPEWIHTIEVILIISIVMLAGRFLSHRLFFMAAKTNLREVFTATSLAVVIGITLLMQYVGTSPALGAFVGGVVLANSEYKRTIETDIEPFKGLLLGLFFISVGMSINFTLFMQQPGFVLLSVAAIITAKSLILLVLGLTFGLSGIQTIGFALSLSQVGEFAFVLFKFSDSLHVIPTFLANFFTLVVALSMACTPFLMLIYYRFIIPKYMSKLPDKKFDAIDEKNAIILAGYGRFGQIIGRFLHLQGVKLTILEKDPEQVELLQRLGFTGYFGDASRLDLLKNAGAKQAKMLIVAVDDVATNLEIVNLAKESFPNLKIYARARNRRHAYELHKAGVDYFKRETFDSALAMAKDIMITLGNSEEKMRRRAKAFAQLDEGSLQKSFEFFEHEPELISFLKQVNGELEEILQSDLQTEQTKGKKKPKIPAGKENLLPDNHSVN